VNKIGQEMKPEQKNHKQYFAFFQPTALLKNGKVSVMLRDENAEGYK
jgi:hypothetical protein